MPTLLTDVEFAEHLRTFTRTARRLELQPVYLEPEEEATVAKFVAGQPEPPTEVPGLRSWFEQIAELTVAGKHVERVRVHEDLPTDYQRWERWAGQWNTAAGETIRYMTRTQAHAIGLLPAAGDVDWWLLDSELLIMMMFDGDGHRTRNELVADPLIVAQAQAWWDLAVRHSTPDPAPSAAA
ncbi:DUF6879 family protein [Plantactinospora sp. DSM 117369]